MLSIKRDFFAYLDEFAVITILLPYSYHQGECTSFLLIDYPTKLPLHIERKEKMQHFVKYTCSVEDTVELGKRMEVQDEFGGITDLQIGAIIRTEEFDKCFFYSGPLGVQYTSSKSDFYLWAPTAQQVKLVLQHPSSSEEERDVFEMERKEKGVWTASISKNLDGYYYSYLVLYNLEWREAVDPYAVAVSVNGKTGVIVDLNKTKRIKPKLPPLDSPVDSIIYETHIRDFSIHSASGVKEKGKYLGVTELNTKTKDGELTGLSYVKDLGVTHIEFLPVHDFEEIDELEVLKKYNWGYNPSHFNVPEGSYSSNPLDPYARIRELKKMVSSVQKQGLRVIIDVVYNHVYKKEDSSFEKIVPGYFFRYDKYGMPANGTGVGNDIASERSMARRYILDSVQFWLEEYQIDGLRFDLMGILDVQTMRMVRELCDKINSSILIIGEGWNLSTPLLESDKAIIANQQNLPRIAQFNDQFRDKIKGSTFQLNHLGFALGNEEEKIEELLGGSIGLNSKAEGIFSEPIQTVNYVESHDNHTLWDKIELSIPQETDEVKQKRHRLATSMVLVSQGIPFIHSGQEFFRTKYGVENSYQSPDHINCLDWERKTIYKKNVSYIKALIAIRKKIRAFRLQTREEIRKHVSIQYLSKSIILYQLKDISVFDDTWTDIKVIINAGKEKSEYLTGSGIWKVLVEGEKIYTNSNPIINEKVTVYPISITIIGKEKDKEKEYLSL